MCGRPDESTTVVQQESKTIADRIRCALDETDGDNQVQPTGLWQPNDEVLLIPLESCLFGLKSSKDFSKSTMGTMPNRSNCKHTPCRTTNANDRNTLNDKKVDLVVVDFANMNVYIVSVGLLCAIFVRVRSS
ncbi:hypothetical protein Tcan_04784 [Toxocara canis]|uniref:Uncharacterized protein n=1 Tax=Toxocara canis TaxID=6265 RepID=A0A0B2V0N0_TOXCA|nr:hypothetical protein Tcan_04784 [Toxocara canis]